MTGQHPANRFERTQAKLTLRRQLNAVHTLARKTERQLDTVASTVAHLNSDRRIQDTVAGAITALRTETRKTQQLTKHAADRADWRAIRHRLDDIHATGILLDRLAQTAATAGRKGHLTEVLAKLSNVNDRAALNRRHLAAIIAELTALTSGGSGHSRDETTGSAEDDHRQSDDASTAPAADDEDADPADQSTAAASS